jgi:hypothetical protein
MLMKKLLTSRLMLLMAVVLVMPLCFYSCDDEATPDPPPPPPNQDGFYVFGSNTIATLATDEGARLALATLDYKQGSKVEDMAGVYGKFMYIGANSTIQFMEVKDKVATTFGATDGGTVTLGTDIGNVPINDMVVHGELLVDGPAIEIEDEGLYYTYLNSNDKTFLVVPVKAQIIGDATEAQWSAGTPLPLKSTSKTQTVFEAQNLVLFAEHGYRYRVNDGWHVYQDPNIVTLSSLGVEELWPDAWAKDHNDIGFFLENAPHKETGKFTVTLTFNAQTGEWTETKTKTGIVTVDYSNHQMSIFGNAYVTAPEDTASWTSGEDGYGLHAPEKDGEVYTWHWENVDLIEGREFIFLQDGAWGGLLIDFTGAANSGTAINDGNIVDATTVGGEYHNYFVSDAGSYDITLVINAETDGRTITFTKN